MFAKIIGTGSYAPDLILDNFKMSEMVETSDEWIVERTGIRKRHICSEMENYQMGAIASKRALENAGLDADDIDMIIVTTVTPDYMTPSMACCIQGQIGASKAFAFDMNVGCTGFVYALDMADAFIKTGKAKNVLIVSSEILSRITDYTDRTTCVLFGDGAGAAVLTADENTGILGSYLAAEGEKGDVLIARGLRNNSVFTDFKDDGLKGHFLKMDGKEVYKFAVNALPKAFDMALENAGINASDIKYLFAHQANERILKTVIKKYGFDEKTVPMNISEYGNTSSASIPILLDEYNKKGMIKKGDIIAFSGFGSGLTYGAVVAKM